MRKRPSIAQSGGTQGDPNIQIQFSLQGQAPFTISLDRALPPLLAEYTIIGPGPSILSIQRSAVESVRENTPFGSAGLAKGDTILGLDTAPVTTPEEFRKQVRRAMVVHGDCLLSVSRAGKTLELAVYFPLPQ